MKPKGKDAKGAKTYYRLGPLVKDVVPINIKNPPRDYRPYKVPDAVPPIPREGNKVVNYVSCRTGAIQGPRRMARR
jgi:hypothetical protein